MLRNRLMGCAAGTSLALLLGLPAFAADYNEAPDLAAQVEAGQLPPVAERLPATPMTVEAPEVGVYGGTWRSALKGNNDEGWIRRSAGYDPLVKFDFEWNSIEPNVAESFEVNDEATRYTFHLRKGHKWSDGTPFTSDDLVFAIMDVINNADYTGTRPKALLGVTATAPDPETLVIEMPAPNGMLLTELASVNGTQVVQFQKAYCSQFHPAYNPDANENAKAAGLAGWGEMMRQHCGVGRARDADRPTLYAWDQVDNYDGIKSPIRFTRNPYYFKVDQEGNQLPYLDDLSMTQVEDVNSIVLMGIAGEIDMTNRHIDSVANKPVFFDNQEKGGYQLYSTVPADMNTLIFQLNLNYEDDGFRELFQNKDFRIALSHGIDRQEIIDTLYVGLGEPYQAAPRPESRFYDEEMAKQYTEYDPDLANQMLDDIGLTERNGDGIRLLPDGRPLSIRVDVTTDLGQMLDILELVRPQWKEIGVDLDARKGERSYVYELKDNNRHMAHAWKGDGGLGDAQIDARYYVPSDEESAYALMWAKNFFQPDANDKQEPPAAVAAQIETYKEMFRSPTDEKRAELFRKVLETAKDQFYTIGVSLPPLSFGIATNEMQNVPEKQPQSWIYPTPGPMNTSILFKRQ
ncbi:ABC transporter substrate-binding protein [Acuticoccus sp. MNP-M23]|uniref:ABC transporter substrate-binding protein n=1 Tax=Acuticoccus sp. MNP-M23 TaxID=3072793 RepID=UPI002814C850|nr:ABC transporter substrate-binding protein [Acuticoccus sp. MNP-M23]WMS44570.1 ABC transporter substrate-binding protein [Acuticoccus sp. MNP-M23]